MIYGDKNYGFELINDVLIVYSANSEELINKKSINRVDFRRDFSIDMRFFSGSDFFYIIEIVLFDGRKIYFQHVDDNYSGGTRPGKTELLIEWFSALKEWYLKNK